MYSRTVKVRSKNGTINEYVRVVEAYREDGKVKQRVVADLGRKDLLVELLPKLRRLLDGDAQSDSNDPADPRVVDASTWGPILVVRALFDQLGLWAIRRNAQIDGWLDAVDDTKWVRCPGGINTRERKTDPPRTVPNKSPPEIPPCVLSSSTPTSAAATSKQNGNRRWSEPASDWRSSRGVSPRGA